MIKYQLYLLQIENYQIDRFFRLLFKKGYFVPSAPLRKSLVWTKKAMLILAISFILIVVSAYLCLNLATWLAIVWILLSILILPIYFSLAVYLMLPFDLLAKYRLMSRARRLVLAHPDVKIIGIAGSYGKTTMKNVLEKILSEELRVVMPSGNTNTAVGLSAWILRHGLKEADVLLIEFGEEYPGDNRRVASIFPQDSIIITGINEAHFERMGSLEKSAATIFEALESAKAKATIYLNSADENVIRYHKSYVHDFKVEKYDGDGCGEYRLRGKSFNPEVLSWCAELEGVGEIKVPFLAEYIFSDIAVASHLASNLGVASEQIKRGISKISPVEHRLQPIVNEASGVLVIDDSYNGNPTGVEEAIKTLSLFETRRKIYLTPGLVEAGKHNKTVHEKIGELLAGVADKVILIKNSATPHISEGLTMAGFDSNNIIWFRTAQEAHSSLGDILESGDVILFQNDWGDQYF